MIKLDRKSDRKSYGVTAPLCMIYQKFRGYLYIGNNESRVYLQFFFSYCERYAFNRESFAFIRENHIFEGGWMVNK